MNSKEFKELKECQGRLNNNVTLYGALILATLNVGFMKFAWLGLAVAVIVPDIVKFVKGLINR